MEYIVVYITCPDEDSAEKIAGDLVKEQLAGCVNIIKGIRSIYRWEGRIEDDSEALMIVKTRKELFDRLKKRVKEIHPYSVPEIIALPITAGSDDYLDWLEEVTLQKG
jgi:periplasmic divalent cation tolerance protein